MGFELEDASCFSSGPGDAIIEVDIALEDSSLGEGTPGVGFGISGEVGFDGEVGRGLLVGWATEGVETPADAGDDPLFIVDSISAFSSSDMIVVATLVISFISEISPI
jgi:hypothetical protein